MKKIIVLGDGCTDARYHAVSNLQPLMDALGNEYEFTVKENYSVLELGELDPFNACINYIDNWEKKGSQQCQDAILSYVGKGGNLLTLHNGIITKNSQSLLLLNGATFMGHEAYSELKYRETGVCPELQVNMENFKMPEEPYQYKFMRTEGMEVFLEYQYKDKWYPAGWKIPFKKGRVIYLAPGHDEKTFRNQTYLAQIKRVLSFLTQS